MEQPLTPADVPAAQERPLHPAIKHVWRLKLGLLTAAFVLLVLAYEVFHAFDARRDFPFGVLTGVALTVGLALTLGLPRLVYRYWHFDLRPDALYLERGVFNRVRTLVPLRRIQHLDVSQDVFERHFGLGKLIVHTAGTRSSDVVLPGLAYAEAEHLRDAVRHYITEDAV